MNLEIRTATPDDAQTIAKVLLAAFVEFRPLYTQGGFEATTPSAELIRLRLGTGGPSWIAQLDGESVGTVSALRRDSGVYVRSMAVVPTARGQGVAAALLRTVEAYAAEQGVNRLTLTTTPFLFPAIRLYERFGYIRTGVADLEGTPLITMEKTLAFSE